MKFPIRKVEKAQKRYLLSLEALSYSKTVLQAYEDQLQNAIGWIPTEDEWFTNRQEFNSEQKHAYKDYLAVKKAKKRTENLAAKEVRKFEAILSELKEQQRIREKLETIEVREKETIKK